MAKEQFDNQNEDQFDFDEQATRIADNFMKGPGRNSPGFIRCEPWNSDPIILAFFFDSHENAAKFRFTREIELGKSMGFRYLFAPDDEACLLEQR